jgi:hypothetical protein
MPESNVQLQNVGSTNDEMQKAQEWLHKNIDPPGFVSGIHTKEWWEYMVFQVLGWNGVPYISHWPPANEAATTHMPTAYCAVGRRGLAVKEEARKSPLKTQPVRLTWAGLDIDVEDNRERYQTVTDEARCILVGEETLVEKVKRLLGDKLMVRTSKSGKGAHCFLRIKDAPEMSYDKARAVAKLALAPYIKLLKDNNILCCVTGLPNLWMWTYGGLQRTLSMPDYDEDVSAMLEATPFNWANSQPEWSGYGHVSLESFGPKTRDIILTLCKAGVLTTPPATRTQVNVARVKKALEGQVDFKTLAKGREGHEHEPNGVLTLNESEIKLLSNADNNKVVFKMVEL